MLYQMKTLNFKKLQTEFLMLTEFHYGRVNESIQSMNIDDEVKVQMMNSLDTFKSDLFEMANYDGVSQDTTAMHQKYSDFVNEMQTNSG